MVPDGYVVNVDVAIRRPALDASGDDPDGRAHEYLFIVRSETEDHAPGTLGFPGGTVEAGPGGSAVLRQTGRREVREEVGVAVEDLRYVTSTTFESDTGSPCLDVLLRAEHAGGDARVGDPDEVADVTWLTPDAVLDDGSTPAWTRALLRAALELESESREASPDYPTGQ